MDQPTGTGRYATSGEEESLGLQAGITIDNYYLEKELGAGGMGVVYLAKDTGLSRLAAMKFILGGGHGANPKALKRFLLEAQVSAQLSHPYIVKVFQTGSYNGLPYIAMECVEGQEYSDYIEQEGIPLEQHLKIIAKVARGLHFAHEQGVIHRDIKPSNIFIRTNDDPVIMDFGVARVNKEDQGLTKTGEMVGTIKFMAPEQAEGRKDELDGQADVYALGGVLYYILTGNYTVQGETMMEQLFSILYREAPNPRSIDENIPEVIENICLKSLAKEKKDRYASCLEMAEDIEKYLAGEAVERDFTSKKRLMRRLLEIYYLHRPLAKKFIYAVLLIIVFMFSWNIYQFWERRNLEIQETQFTTIKNEIARLYKRKEYERIRNVFKQVEKKNADQYKGFYRWHLEKGKYYTVQNKVKLAKQQFLQAEQLAPNNQEVLFNLAKLYHQQQDFAQADKYIQNYYQNSQEHGFDILFLEKENKKQQQKDFSDVEGKILALCQEELKAAKSSETFESRWKNIDDLLKKKPDYYPAYRYKLDLAFNRYLFDTALEIFSTLLSLPIGTTNQKEIATLFFDKFPRPEYPQKQIEVCEKLLATSNLSDEISQKAKSFFVSKVVAIEATEKTICEKAKNFLTKSSPLYYKIYLYLVTDSEHTLKQLLTPADNQQQQDNPKIQKTWAKFYGKKEQYTQAFPYLKSALKTFPEDIDLRWYLANYYIGKAKKSAQEKQNNLQLAIEQLNKCVEKEPWRFEFYEARSSCYFQIPSQLGKAEQDFVRCLELKPDRIDIFNQLVNMTLDNNFMDSAKHLTLVQSINNFKFNNDLSADLFFPEKEKLAEEVFQKSQIVTPNNNSLPKENAISSLKAALASYNIHPTLESLVVQSCSNLSIIDLKADTLPLLDKKISQSTIDKTFLKKYTSYFKFHFAHRDNPNKKRKASDQKKYEIWKNKNKSTLDRYEPLIDKKRIALEGFYDIISERPNKLKKLRTKILQSNLFLKNIQENIRKLLIRWYIAKDLQAKKELYYYDHRNLGLEYIIRNVNENPILRHLAAQALESFEEDISPFVNSYDPNIVLLTRSILNKKEIIKQPLSESLENVNISEIPEYIFAQLVFSFPQNDELYLTSWIQNKKISHKGRLAIAKRMQEFGIPNANAYIYEAIFKEKDTHTQSWLCHTYLDIETLSSRDYKRVIKTLSSFQKPVSRWKLQARRTFFIGIAKLIQVERSFFAKQASATKSQWKRFRETQKAKGIRTYDPRLKDEYTRKINNFVNKMNNKVTSLGVIPILKAGIKDQDVFIRFQSIFTLGLIKPDIAFETVKNPKEDFLIRGAAFNAMTGERDIEEVFIGLLNDPKKKLDLLRALQDKDRNITIIIRSQLGFAMSEKIVKNLLMQELSGNNEDKIVGCALSVIGDNGKHAKETLPVIYRQLNKVDWRENKPRVYKQLLAATAFTYTRWEEKQHELKRNISKLIKISKKSRNRQEYFKSVASGIMRSTYSETDTMIRILREENQNTSIHILMNWDRLYPVFVRLLLGEYKRSLTKHPKIDYKDNFSAFERNFEYAIKLDPKNAQYLFEHGLLHFTKYFFEGSAENLNKAQENIEKAIKLKPRTTFNQWLACILRHRMRLEPAQKKKYGDKSLKILDAILKDNPWNYYALWEKRYVLEELGKTDEVDTIVKTLNRISQDEKKPNKYPYRFLVDPVKGEKIGAWPQR